MSIENVLAARYASSAMMELFSSESKIVFERQLWVAILIAQKQLGIEISDKAIEDYEAVIHEVNLPSINEREKVTRHDVKARIEEFCSLAGHEQIHQGMTSRDLTENIEQLQIRKGLEIIIDRVVAALAGLSALAIEHEHLAIVGRTHNVPAQITTLGKRFASTAEELLISYHRLNDFLNAYPLRGIKGPVGTQQDQVDLFSGDSSKVFELEQIVAKHLEDNKIVAWFQGRSEHGPRALGSRSILMSPSKKENKDIMNSRVKHREYWRPFAGITLEGRGYDLPYMLYSEQVLTDDVPAITHEDNTCRMQTVNDELNPRMCDLLRKLENPILLNTSFNDNGEPIVESPKDAIMAFKNMDIDYLVMGNYLIS